MSRQTPSERLLARLTATGVPMADGQTIVRTYASHAQRSAGAWVWRLAAAGSFVWVGSIFPVTDLVRRPRLCAVFEGATREWSVYPHVASDSLQPSDTFLIEPERSTR